jgi:hypothetical protein
MKYTTTSEIKLALAIIGITLLLVTAILTMTVGIANAESATATRTLPAEPVSADESFFVEIEVSDYGNLGKVLETLPEGFRYQKSSLDHKFVNDNVSTNTVEFRLVDVTSFTYTVRAPDVMGTYMFTGILKGIKNKCEVGGDMEIEVEEAEDDAEPTATRTLPEELVSAGEVFTIELEASHYGYFGKVVETLPDGFEFEDSTLNSESIEVEDETVEFTLEGEPSFTYTVTAPDEEDTYTFEGILIDEEKDEYDIGGDTEIVVGEEAGEVILLVNITAGKPVENTSSVIGTWNVSAIATNTTTGLSDMHTWIWRVTATPVANITSTPTPTSAVATAPLVTPTPKSKVSPRPTSSATPTPAKSAKPTIPGFEPVFALAAIFGVLYLRLFRKKGDEGR